jgi:hypothetical protein
MTCIPLPGDLPHIALSLVLLEAGIVVVMFMHPFVISVGLVLRIFGTVLAAVMHTHLDHQLGPIVLATVEEMLILTSPKTRRTPPTTFDQEKASPWFLSRHCHIQELLVVASFGRTMFDSLVPV